MENHGKENCEKLNEHGKARKSMVSYNLKNKPRKNHGKPHGKVIMKNYMSMEKARYHNEIKK